MEPEHYYGWLDISVKKTDRSMKEKKPTLTVVHEAEDTSMSPLGYALVKAVFEDDHEGIAKAEAKLIATTPTLSVVPNQSNGHKKTT